MRLLGLITLLLTLSAASAQPDVAPAPKPAGLFPAVSAADAWAKLPPLKQPALPEWARVLAGPLPKTTAKMLELDYLHREKNPLGPELAAVLRWAVAATLGSKYGISIAEADLHSAGVPPKFLPRLSTRKELPADIRIAADFA